MKRRIFAAAWLAGATVPLPLATVVLLGCCVLPFHARMHELMPICEMAANVLRGDHAAPEHRHDATSSPARETQEPVKRVVTEVPSVFRLAAAAAAARVTAPTPAAGDRSFITLGGARCDRDVGRHVVVQRFLI